ncbi:MAG TPA: nuclear transport factor 2 family protein [Amycolatopsis sp.]|uniref:nuclear transport factor 2 family protein n=1 Tax=Amycolatopsis sp. TaxID=37632 RepID=UPI002B478C3D|nr:nuclear transport factor 2 family protein [Amycolatopsis sp.]HKS44405.1 nuclear transport factor 2 family protein [Amycolatopsis sp.]
MNTFERFRDAVDRRDHDTMRDLLAPGVRFFSPVRFTPYVGRELVFRVFGVLMRRVFDNNDYRYVGEVSGRAETSAGRKASTHILIFRGTVRGRQVHGIDLIQLNDDGLVEEVTVMVRPQTALTALGDAVLAGLAAEGLATA